MEEKRNIPVHVAVIMDGNGRWAEKNNLTKIQGHNQGMYAMKEIIKRSDVLGVKYLTVYAFSTENWKRSTEEVGGIFKLAVKFIAQELKELHENNVKVNILGDYRSRVPEDAVLSMDKAVETTKNNTGLQFNIALNYGSRAEIVRGVKKIAESVKNGDINVDDIDEDMLSMNLYTGAENGNIPDPELVIRTSGEERLSNFLLWQVAYSEFFFTDTLWPDFTPDEYEEILNSFGKRNRRFGGR
ncbi:MAG: isoprenyl transferase [Clostridia bacterium]|nr:isoprenyl transferase [Clostridia bacterium]